jgi:hypothetical protein
VPADERLLSARAGLIVEHAVRALVVVVVDR